MSGNDEGWAGADKVPMVFVQPPDEGESPASGAGWVVLIVMTIAAVAALGFGYVNWNWWTEDQGLYQQLDERAEIAGKADELTRYVNDMVAQNQRIRTGRRRERAVAGPALQLEIQRLGDDYNAQRQINIDSCKAQPDICKTEEDARRRREQQEQSRAAASNREKAKSE